jgi:hypothetical protein
MTAPNPFIELFRDPVFVLSALGYLVLLVGILLFGIPHAVRILIEDVYQDWQQNADRPNSKWERLWGTGTGYIPPFAVGLRALWAFVVLFVVFQATGALVWFIGG